MLAVRRLMERRCGALPSQSSVTLMSWSTSHGADLGPPILGRTVVAALFVAVMASCRGGRSRPVDTTTAGGDR